MSATRDIAIEQFDGAKHLILTDRRVIVDESAFMALYEYSTTLPTGQRIGKRWRRRTRDGWLMGEYVDDPDPKKIGIRWRSVLLLRDTPGG